jgi:Protein of unknown function DUF262
MNPNKSELSTLWSLGRRRVITEIDRMTLADLRDEIASKKLIQSDFDYKWSVTWNVETQSQLIESFLLNIPVPPLVAAYSKGSNARTIIDGEQRVKTICDFLGNRFSLWGLHHWSELEGLYFDDLPQNMREALLRQRIKITAILYDEMAHGFDPDLVNRTVYQQLNFFRPFN